MDVVILGEAIGNKQATFNLKISKSWGEKLHKISLLLWASETQVGAVPRWIKCLYNLQILVVFCVTYS